MADDLLRTPSEAASALPPGTRLGEFELRSLLGVGGFGIVYLAFDHALEREVAIKEYMPASMAGRTETMHVSLRSQSDAEVFALGLRSFVNEAKLLARFDHPSLLKVHRFWEANGTAYMAMPVLRGRTLKDLRQGRQSLENPIDERWLRRVLDPLLGALDRLHGEGVYHRDIAPDNILIEPDGRPVLLDFGAARRVISDKTQTLTAILKPAYAPIEQYAEAGSVKQGPWTDLYALGATLHYMLLGQPPAPATARAVNDDEQAPLANQTIAGCGEDFLHVIDWMLAPRPGDRPQSVAALRAVLEGRAPPPQRRPASAVSPSQWEKTQIVAPVSKAAPAAPPSEARDEDATVVVPPPRPPAGSRVVPDTPASRAAASARSAPAAASAAARGVGAEVDPVAIGGAPRRAAVASPAPPPAAAAAASAAGRSKAVPIGIGVGVVAAVAVAAALFWPGRGAEPSLAARPAASEAALGAPAPAQTTPAPAAVAAPAATTDSTPARADAPGAQAAPTAQREPPPPSPAGTSGGTSAGSAGTAAAPTATAPVAPVAPPVAGPRSDPKAAAPAGRPGVTGATAGTAPAAATGRPAESTSRAGTAPRAPAAPAVSTVPPPAAPAARAEPAAAPVVPPVQAAAPPPAPAAPAADAASPAPAKPVAGPEARCSGRNPIMYFACMERECYRSEFMQHADCLAWRRNARPQQ